MSFSADGNEKLGMLIVSNSNRVIVLGSMALNGVVMISVPFFHICN